ncbi:MAG: bifunctional (p)ppGpp synthetase/guanosine-3',5'-bis(diphosphate) 3'-pyrophosphohydrolase [Myxococcales bacterium]|nr:bifunctional (p)ppGpp synthetase/guanosine-3',5'-bis(diphosphate) 3'-pyrophosphohydrolase [Myxococcales bacterium]
MSTLEEAILIATAAHRGQRDRGGVPYILHPLRVMGKVSGSAERIAAVLHDVVEDTSVTLDDLRRAGFSDEIVDAVDALTRRESEGYDAFIRRLMPNAVARRVKIADLEDNLDLLRLPQLAEHDFQRLIRYRKAHARLTEKPPVATKPNPERGE